ncbi:hypothetical protein [Comamonas serinivorans]|nr:hypothetical protein [Comamonas serinivorans]
MKRLTTLALLAGCITTGAWAQAVYTYTSPAYTSATGDFTTAMQLTGSITSATALPPNLNEEPVGPGTSYPVTWSFSDGVRTFNNSNSANVFGAPGDFWVSTDASGTLTAAQVYLMSPGPAHTVNQPIHLMLAGSLTTWVRDNMVCTTVIGSQCTGTGVTPTTGYATPGDSVVGTWSQTITPVTAAPKAVPTLAWPALALLTTLVAGAAGYRRKAVAARA